MMHSPVHNSLEHFTAQSAVLCYIPDSEYQLTQGAKHCCLGALLGMNVLSMGTAVSHAWANLQLLSSIPTVTYSHYCLLQLVQPTPVTTMTNPEPLLGFPCPNTTMQSETKSSNKQCQAGAQCSLHIPHKL